MLVATSTIQKNSRMKKRHHTKNRLLKNVKIYPLIITAFFSSCITYVATAKASQQVALHYVPISITTSPLGSNVDINTLTISNIPTDNFANIQEIHEPPSSLPDKNVILHGDRIQ